MKKIIVVGLAALAALGADAASVALTAKGEIVSAQGCRVTEVVAERDAGGELSLSFQYEPASGETALTLSVTGLYPHNWILQTGGWNIGKWPVAEFARGIRLDDARKGVYIVSKRGGQKKPSNWDSFWSKILVEVKSTHDGTMQPCYFWAPEKARTNAVPLIVGLHTWSASYHYVSHYEMALKHAQRKGWAMVGPNFRGPNLTPPACGGEAAVQDIVDAVNYAKAHAQIDPKRVYIIGGSGGGHMTLLMLGRHPEIFAAGAAFCPITDLARWHADSLLDHPGRGKRYATMMEAACGGTPGEKPEEYRRRSPLAWLDRARAAGVGVYIVTGIHDGWVGSVPVGHSFRAFNALAREKDRVDEATIAAIEATRQVPASLTSDNLVDPFYGKKNRIHFRRTSRNVRFTLMEGGHGGNSPAGLDFLSRQVKGCPTDFTIPATGKGGEEALGK